jgi:ATP-dependent phosphoenolpyruvate carboxykinase
MIFESRNAEMPPLSALTRYRLQNHLVSGTREPWNAVPEVM